MTFIITIFMHNPFTLGCSYWVNLCRTIIKPLEKKDVGVAFKADPKQIAPKKLIK